MHGLWANGKMDEMIITATIPGGWTVNGAAMEWNEYQLLILSLCTISTHEQSADPSTAAD